MKIRNKSLIKRKGCVVDKNLFDSDKIIFDGIYDNIKLDKK